MKTLSDRTQSGESKDLMTHIDPLCGRARRNDDPSLPWTASKFVSTDQIGEPRLVPMQMVWIVSIFALVYLAQVVGAYAAISCKRIEELPTVSDTGTLRLLEAYVKTFGDFKPWLVRQLSRRFFIALPDDENCKSSGCYYHLLQSKDSEIKERFSFKGTGVILSFLSPAEVRIEGFQDRFETIALETAAQSYESIETSAQSHIVLGLPRTGETVLVGVRAPQQVKLPTCGTRSK